MTPTHLLDTGWIIRHLRGDRAYTQTLHRLGPEYLAVSVVSVAELYEGVFRARDPDAAEQAVQTFLRHKSILAITDAVCRVFGRHRADLRQQNQLIGDLDLLIAATCMHHNLILLTTNPQHFQRVRHLGVISRPGP